MTAPDRIALVTGAASGIGRRAAERWSDAGWRVVALDVDEAGLERHLARQGGVDARRLDVTDGAAVRSLVAEVEQRIGPIRRVFNAAGVLPVAGLESQDGAAIRRVFEINTFGPVHVCQAVMGPMRSRGRGELVNVASIAGWVPSYEIGAYSASKAALAAYTEVLHRENRSLGLRVVCCCPGRVRTPLIAQLERRPRIFDWSRAVTADRVVESAERALARHRLWAFCSLETAMIWRLRRFAPALLAAAIRRIERRR